MANSSAVRPASVTARSTSAVADRETSQVLKRTFSPDSRSLGPLTELVRYRTIASVYYEIALHRATRSKDVDMNRLLNSLAARWVLLVSGALTLSIAAVMFATA